MNRVVKKKGFTIVELMLAMTFIALLLIAIAMTTIQISNIYTRGITLREVNQAGLAVTSDLERTIAGSTPFTISGAPGATQYLGGVDGGRLCTGEVTYAWNYGKTLLQDRNAYNNRYSDGRDEIKMVRVKDSGGTLCQRSGAAGTYGMIDRAKATELLSIGRRGSGGRDLVIHNFTIRQVAESTGTRQALYRINVVVGTNNRSLDDSGQILTSSFACKPPSDRESDQEYCAVNNFELTVRAGNRV